MKRFGKKSWRSRSARLMALGTLAAYAASGSKTKAIAWAQVLDSKSTSQGPPAQLSVRRFNIAAGPLDGALDEFHSITGIQVTLSLPKDSIVGFRTQGAHGLLTEQQAMQQLLSGTGLTHVFTAPDAIDISIRNSESVTVNGSGVPSTLAISKFTQPLLNTPQSITAIPAQLLSDEGVSTLRDTLRNSPGISLAAGEGALQGDNLTIRGFSATDDIFLDGVRDFGSYYRDPFNYEAVEVLEGPAGVQFGRGSTGGVINQESKVAGLRPFMNFDAGLGTDLTRRFTGDIDAPLPKLAGGAAFRLNFMGNDADIAQRDVVTNRRFGVAPTLTAGLNTPTRLISSYLHFQEDDIPDYGLPWYFGRPAPVARHNYYGFSDHNFLRTNVDIGTVRAESDLSSHVIVHDIARYAHYERGWQITEPQVNNSSAGTITPETPLNQVMVNRNQLAGTSVEAQLWDQADITLTGKLLGIRQTAVVGSEGGRESSDPIRPKFTNPAGINTVPLTSLLNPNPYQAFSGTAYPSTNVHTTAFSAAVYLLDTFELSRKWELSGGIRLDHFDANYKSVTNTFSAATGVDTVTYPQYEQDLNKGTWRAALVFKPKPDGSIYFDYGTSFDPSAESLALSAANYAVPPEENESFEAGSKWQVNNGRLTLRAAYFLTNRENVLEPDPTNSAVDVLAGNQRADGVEGVVQGRLTDRWEILSSYTFLHSEVLNSAVTLADYPSSIGLPLQNVPQNLFNLWTEYRLPRGFEVGAGSNFVGARDANSTTLTPGTILETAPGYWNFNAMAKYAVTERISVQANVNNVFDRFFLDELHPGHVIPGPGASALFGAKFRF